LVKRIERPASAFAQANGSVMQTPTFLVRRFAKEFLMRDYRDAKSWRGRFAPA